MLSKVAGAALLYLARMRTLINEEPLASLCEHRPPGANQLSSLHTVSSIWFSEGAIIESAAGCAGNRVGLNARAVRGYLWKLSSEALCGYFKHGHWLVRKRCPATQSLTLKPALLPRKDFCRAAIVRACMRVSEDFQEELCREGSVENSVARGRGSRNLPSFGSPMATIGSHRLPSVWNNLRRPAQLLQAKLVCTCFSQVEAPCYRGAGARRG